MFTYNELYDMFYNTFKRDLTDNIRNKANKTLEEVLKPYVDYMISLRDCFIKQIVVHTLRILMLCMT